MDVEEDHETPLSIEKLPFRKKQKRNTNNVGESSIHSEDSEEVQTLDEFIDNSNS